MNVDLGIWAKLNRLVIVLLGVAGVLAIALKYFPLIKQNEKFRQRILQLENQIQKEEEIGKQAKASIVSLRDSKVIERLAREKLGYAKAGETVFRFEAPLTNNFNRR
jgi:cell division protein FtsB